MRVFIRESDDGISVLAMSMASMSRRALDDIRSMPPPRRLASSPRFDAPFRLTSCFDGDTRPDVRPLGNFSLGHDGRRRGEGAFR